MRSKTQSAFPHPKHEYGQPSLSPCSPPQIPWHNSRKKFTFSQGWATTWPPKGSTYHLSSILPFQPFCLCMAMVSGTSSLSGTIEKYSEVLTSHPSWASLGGQDCDGEGKETDTRGCRDVSPQPHWLLRFLCHNGLWGRHTLTEV